MKGISRGGKYDGREFEIEPSRKFDFPVLDGGPLPSGDEVYVATDEIDELGRRVYVPQGVGLA